MLITPETPERAEVDAHLATHLPHADWCDLCMKGRGINTRHRMQKKKSKEDEPGSGDDRVASSGSLESPAPAAQRTPEERIDYFYLSGEDEERRMGWIA